MPELNLPTIIQLGDLHFAPYIHQSAITEKVKTIAQQINTDYRGKEIVLVGVLKGAFVFMNKLIQYIDLKMEVEFIRVSSYQGTASTGEMNLSMDYPSSIKGRHIIVVEDIVDTGLTAQYLLDRAATFEPASTRMASLFIKPDSIQTDIEIDYVGFEIPDHFIVGYGMDYDEKGRELSMVYRKVEDQ